MELLLYFTVALPSQNDSLIMVGSSEKTYENISAISATICIIFSAISATTSVIFSSISATIGVIFSAISVTISLTYPMKFVVKTAGVADRISVGISPPQSRRVRVAIGARCPCPSRRRLSKEKDKR